MEAHQPKTVCQALTSRRISRRNAIKYGSGGLAASALTTIRSNPAHAQTADATPDDRIATASTRIDALVADLLAQTGVPGLAVAAVHQDQIVHLAGYGVREAGKPDPVDPDTVFQLASVSKPLASTTVAALVGDGLMSWDTHLTDLDHSIAFSDPWVSREVTLRDLFCHRSGLWDHAGDDLEDLGYGRAEILYRLRYLQPEGPFRAHYAYTNFGLTAAAVAAAGAARMEWEDLAASRLYAPLGMTSTSSRFADFIAAPNRASGHVLVDGSYAAKYQRQPDAQSPAGGVSSSVRDLTQWLRLLLGNGTLDGQQIVDATALGETFRPHITSNPAANPALDRTSFYGLGWNVGYDNQGRVTLNHSGAFALGAATTVLLHPAEDLGIIVLSNAYPIGLTEAVAFSYLDLATTGTIAYDYLSIFGPLFAAGSAPKYGTAIDYSTPPTNPQPPLPLDSYTGTYTNPYFGDLLITASGDTLILHLGPNQTPYPTRHFDHDTFLYQPTGENAAGESALTFTIGADSIATTVTSEILNLNRQGTFNRT